jgi:hypothetical protein
MKKFSIIVATTFILFISAVAQAKQPTFANISWGIDQAELRKHLTSNGFTPSNVDKDGDLKFKGELLGYDAVGFAFLGSGKLVKIQLLIATPDNKAISSYKDLKETLIKKYGLPTSTYQYFKRPYYDGDGYEEQAIRLGKGIFASFWDSSLSVSITEKLAVNLSYESASWSAEVDRRQANRNSVF